MTRGVRKRDEPGNSGSACSPEHWSHRMRFIRMAGQSRRALVLILDILNRRGVVWRCHTMRIKMILKRFMPVARGTRPAYRNKTRGELVFGDSPQHSPAMTPRDLYTCIRRYPHSYRRLPSEILDVTSGLVSKTMTNQASLNSAALRQANVARVALLPRVLSCSPRTTPAAIQMFFATR